MDAQAYIQRKPRQSAHFQLVEDCFEALERAWGGCYASKYGYWRGHVQKIIYEYLDCGDLRHGFARVRCTDCGHECLLPFSCKRRHFCPSCHARRVVEFGEFLVDQVLSDVPHRQWVFTLPKMLRVWFMHDRKLLGELARITWKLLSKFIKASGIDDASVEDASPAAVIAIQTFGEQVNFNPHIHVIAADGCFLDGGAFSEAWAHDTAPLNDAFADAVFKLLSDRGLSDSRIDTIKSWQHSGFQVYRGAQIRAGDKDGLERLAQYTVRCPFAQSRMAYDRESHQVSYRGKTTGAVRLYPALDFLARLVVQIPAPSEQMVRYLGFYSNKCRGMRKKDADTAGEALSIVPSKRPGSKRWARLIAKVFLADPLICPKCRGQMRVISLIEEGDTIAKILRHLGLWDELWASPVAHAPPHLDIEGTYEDEYSQLPLPEYEYEAC